ncbi:MAG: hypothetical protein RIK87_11650 [Fuerstiella sp.]
MLDDWDWTVPALPVDSWWFCAVVLALLMIFIWAIARLTTSATEDIDPAEIDREMLTAVNELRSRGELTQEEFRSIKSHLVRRLADEAHSAGSDDSSQKGRQTEEDKGSSAATAEISGGTELSDDNSGGQSSESSENEVSDRGQSDQS